MKTSEKKSTKQVNNMALQEFKRQRGRETEPKKQRNIARKGSQFSNTVHCNIQ